MLASRVAHGVRLVHPRANDHGCAIRRDRDALGPRDDALRRTRRLGEWTAPGEHDSDSDD